MVLMISSLKLENTYGQITFSTPQQNRRFQPSDHSSKRVILTVKHLRKTNAVGAYDTAVNNYYLLPYKSQTPQGSILPTKTSKLSTCQKIT